MSKQEDFQWYLENKEKLLSNNDYNGKYLVIKNNEVVGAYEKEDDAILQTLEKGIKIDDFIVQLCAVNDLSNVTCVSNVYV